MKKILISLLAAGATQVFAQGGALPKGDLGETGKATGPDESVAKKRRNCFLDLTEPPGGNGHFSSDGKFLYLLAQTGDADDAGDKPAKAKKKKKDKAKASTNPKVRYTLFRISPKTRKSEALVSLEHHGSASLLTYGEPLQAVSAVAFVGPSAGCYEGPAGVVTVSFAKKDDKAVQESGVFELVETPKGLRLVDAKKDQILALDATTFQSKLDRKVPKDERPLFYDPESKQLVVWHDAGDHRGLVSYAGEDDQSPKRLAFKKGDRVLSQGNRFAVAQLDITQNTIKVQEVADWTGKKKPVAHVLKVPPAYTVASAGMTINFDKKIALVYGANFLAKQKWQRVFVFDYATGDLLGAVPVTGTQYLNFAGIDPTGSYVVVEVRDMATRQTVGGKVFNVAKKAFEDLEFTPP